MHKVSKFEVFFTVTCKILRKYFPRKLPKAQLQMKYQQFNEL